MKDIEQGLKDVAQRIVNAENNFADTVQEVTSCTRKEAFKVLALYRKFKMVKLDAVCGRYTVNHGSFWEEHVLRNAIEY